MTLASPWFLVAAGAAALVVVAMHLLAWRRPTPTALPTARFIPPAAVRAISRDLRLSDALLLAVRVLVVLLAGLALARPAWLSRTAGRARVIVVDASRAVARMAESADSARTYTAGAAHVSWVRVDSTARLLGDSAIGERAEVLGALGAGMVVAVREATRLTRRYAEVEVVVVSPFARESWDDGVAPVRDVWSGRVIPVRVASRTPDSTATAVTEAALRLTGSGRGGPVYLPPPTDPVGAAVALAVGESPPWLRLRRAAPLAEDSVWAKAGGTLVWWRGGTSDGGVSASPLSWSAELVTTGERSAIGSFARLELGTVREGGSIVARWGDGAIAATETPLGAGCAREVGVDVNPIGDAALRPGFVQLVRALVAPCRAYRPETVDDATLLAWANPSPVPADRGDAAAPGAPDQSPRMQRLLLLAAAALLATEWWLRRRTRTLAHRAADLAFPGERRVA